MPQNWLLWAFLSAVFAALTAILSKVGLRDVDSDFAQFVRTAVVIVVLVAFMLATGKWRGASEATSRTWLYLILAGFATAASWMCYFRGLQIGEAARVAAVDKLSVAMVAVFAVLLLGDKLSGLGWLGVALTTAGAMLLALAR
jgi:transporter family protein